MMIVIVCGCQFATMELSDMYAQNIYQIVRQEMWQNQRSLSDIIQILMETESNLQPDIVRFLQEQQHYVAMVRIVSVSQEEALALAMVESPDGFN